MHDLQGSKFIKDASFQPDQNHIRPSFIQEVLY
jgi:hypothetical protein